MRFHFILEAPTMRTSLLITVCVFVLASVVTKVTTNTIRPNHGRWVYMDNRTIIQAVGCPEGFVLHGASCYLFSGDKENWPGAVTMCKELGAALVEVNDVAEQEFLSQQIKALHKNQSWIGLSDAAKEGSWVWTNSKKKLTYSNWFPGQPDNKNNNEDCVEMWNNGQWNDAPCDTPGFNYICEVAAS